MVNLTPLPMAGYLGCVQFPQYYKQCLKLNTWSHAVYVCASTCGVSVCVCVQGQNISVNVNND